MFTFTFLHFPSPSLSFTFTFLTFTFLHFPSVSPSFTFLHPFTGVVVGVPSTYSPRQRCLSSAVCSRVGRSRCVHYRMLSNQFFYGGPSSLALQGALQGGFCNGVVSSDVAKPGELTSLHCCQHGLLLSSNGIHLLSHIFVCFML